MGETEGVGPSTCPNGLEIAPGFSSSGPRYLGDAFPVGRKQAPPPPPSFRMKDTTAHSHLTQVNTQVQGRCAGPSPSRVHPTGKVERSQILKGVICEQAAWVWLIPHDAFTAFILKVEGSQ